MSRIRSQWNRRQLLTTVGAGTSIALLGGTANAKGNLGNRPEETPGNGARDCPDCPSGTTPLGKYEFDDGAFVFEKGACDAVTFTEIGVKEGDPNEPVRVCWESDILVESAVVKYGQSCERFGPGDFETYDATKDGTFEGCLDLGTDSQAISYISFCAGVCYQVDLVEGDPIRELGEDGLYSDDGRLSAYIWGGTATEDDSPKSLFDTANCSLDGSLRFNGDGTASATFTVEEGCCELSLVTYLAPCPPEFTEATASQQVLFDYAPDDAFSTTQQFCAADGETTLTVGLPGLDDLGRLCGE